MATSLFFKSASAALMPAAAAPGVAFVDGTNFDYLVLAFEGNDGAADSLCYFFATMPDSYGDGAIEVRIYWIPAAGSPAAENCSWDVSVLGRVDDEAFDAAMGAATTVNDAVTAAGDLQVASAAIAAPGLAAGDFVIIKINRDYDEANGVTSLGEDAHLVGIQVLET